MARLDHVGYEWAVEIIGIVGMLLLFSFAFPMLLELGKLRKEGKERAGQISRLHRRLDLVIKHLGVVEPTPQHPEVTRYLDEGKKISAIAAYKTKTGASLKESKKAVEAIARGETA